MDVKKTCLVCFLFKKSMDNKSSFAVLTPMNVKGQKGLNGAMDGRERQGILIWKLGVFRERESKRNQNEGVD
jgi:hypothetical protein